MMTLIALSRGTAFITLEKCPFSRGSIINSELWSMKLRFDSNSASFSTGGISQVHIRTNISATRTRHREKRKVYREKNRKFVSLRNEIMVN